MAACNVLGSFSMVQLCAELASLVKYIFAVKILNDFLNVTANATESYLA